LAAVHDEATERPERLCSRYRQILVEKDVDLVGFDLGIGPVLAKPDVTGIEQCAASVEEDGPRVDQLRHAARIGKAPQARV
jgi:hypothetical protein